MTASIKNYFSPRPEIDIEIDSLQPDVVNEETELSDQSQVFHVPGNTLVYEDAKAVCDAYGAGAETRAAKRRRGPAVAVWVDPQPGAR